MLFSPIIGIIGGRYSRKMIIIFGVLIWVGSLWAGSLIETPVIDESDSFSQCESDSEVTKKWYLLLTSRIFFGIHNGPKWPKNRN